MLLHAATPQALRASFPVSEQHQQCSADDSNKAGSRFFRQLFKLIMFWWQGTQEMKCLYLMRYRMCIQKKKKEIKKG